MAAPPLFHPLVCVVDFHHARGPEISHWLGAPPDSDPAVENDWGLIPYMALPDGAHQIEEEMSYFTLVHKAREGADVEPTSVFGISCTRQMDSSELLYRPEEVTRSAVQKAVVAITDRPQHFSAVREKLSVVTKAWFAQKDFRDMEILQHFQENLAKEEVSHEDERDQYFGLSLRELLHTFKWQTLVLLKAMLLEPKMLFFGSHCERVCQVQFTLLSLIPGLVRSLRDCADPQMNRYAETLRKPDSVRTSDRSSLLSYMGIPLQIFGKGSIFGPYTPLQQLDTLTDLGTKSYIVGSTNSLLLGQKDRYSDVLINLDEDSVTILSPTLRPHLYLSAADRRWMDFLTQTVNDTWDETEPSRPNTLGYAGSEEFIRLQFEEYLLAMLSATKYRSYLATHTPGDPKALLADIDGDPSVDFAHAFLDAWHETENHALWDRTTDSHLFDIVEPRHPCAGGLSIEDVQRRLAAQVAELHLDERFSQTRDVVGKRLADGRSTVSGAFNKVWADIEVMREAQRKRAEDARVAAAQAAEGEPKRDASVGTASSAGQGSNSSAAHASVASAGQRAGAYLSSWGAWASEKRKAGWKGHAAGGTATSSPRTSMATDRMSVDRSEKGNRPRVTTISELGKEIEVEVVPKDLDADAAAREAEAAKAKEEAKWAELETQVGNGDGEEEEKQRAKKGTKGAEEPEVEAPKAISLENNETKEVSDEVSRPGETPDASTKEGSKTLEKKSQETSRQGTDLPATSENAEGQGSVPAAEAEKQS